MYRKDEKPKNIIEALKEFHLEFEGQLHSGLDDCKNIGRVLAGMLKDGYIPEITGSLQE